MRAKYTLSARLLDEIRVVSIADPNNYTQNEFVYTLCSGK